MDFLLNLVLLTHFLFVIFVIFGGFLVLYQRKWMYVHLPALVWGFLYSLCIICPLTPLEKYLKAQLGQEIYQEDFLQYYLTSILYPNGLSMDLQLSLAVLLCVFNLFLCMEFHCCTIRNDEIYSFTNG